MWSEAWSKFMTHTTPLAKHSRPAARGRAKPARTQVAEGKPIMASKRIFVVTKNLAMAMIAVLLLVGFAHSEAQAREPIVGLWSITSDDGHGTVDHIFSGWTSDGLEFDQDVVPVLALNDCYGTWLKIGKRTYGITHPFYNFKYFPFNGEGDETDEGTWDGTSSVLTYTVQVSKDGKTFTGKGSFTVIDGADPYDPNAQVLFDNEDITLSAKKVSVKKSALPSL